jgi:FkbM family methyltransferase
MLLEVPPRDKKKQSMAYMSEITLAPRYTTLLPSRWGWFCGLSLDKYKTYSTLFQGEWAHDEANILARLVHPGDTVIDAGANVGSLTLALAAMVGNRGLVYAFEPQRYAFGCLWANVALNSILHIVHPIQAAVGDSSGEIICPSVGLTEEKFNSGGLSLRQDGRASVVDDWSVGDKVPLIRIDDMKLERLDMLKADVEGMEPAVLRGAEATIMKCRPVLWCEDLKGSYPHTTEELAACFRKYRYKAWNVNTPIFCEHNIRLSPINMWKGQVDMNVLAVPQEDETPAWIGNAEPFPL